MVAVVLVGVARLALAAGADLEPVALVFDGPDDAYYYFQIAWNLSRGLGSTFDGVHPTSGYQPLWCVLLTVLARLSPSREALLHAAAWAAAALHVGAGVVLAQTSRRFLARPLPALFLILWLWHPGIQHLVVLEAPLNTFLLACFVASAHAALTRAGGERAAAWWKPGLWLAALAMARLDNVALAPAFGLLPLVASRKRLVDRLGDALALAAPVVVTLGIYAALNQHFIGAPLPVSGTIKARWQANAFRMAAEEMWEGSLMNMPLSAKTVGGVAKLFVDMTRLSFVRGVAVLGGAWLPHASEPAGAREMTFTAVWIAWALVVAIRPRLVAAGEDGARLLRAWIGGTALHFAGMVYMVGTFPRTWHWVVEGVLLLFLVPTAVAWLGGALGALAGERGMRAGVAAAATAAAVALGVGAIPEMRATLARFVHGHDVLHPEIDAARWWRGVLPDGTRVGSWNAGHLGYFTDYQIVNLDGLVNTPDYQARIDRDGYLAYFDAEGLRYLLESKDDVNFREILAHGRVIAEHAEKNGTRLLLLELEPYVPATR
jgi:hypothetical protein